VLWLEGMMRLFGVSFKLARLLGLVEADLSDFLMN
jgi:hypothetical protein